MVGVEGLSFPDEPVLLWEYDAVAGRLAVSVAGGLHDAVTGGIDSPIELVIGPAASFSGTRFPVGSSPQHVTGVIEQLKEICECGLGATAGWLAGFGSVSGDWLRYEYMGPATANWRDH